MFLMIRQICFLTSFFPPLHPIFFPFMGHLDSKVILISIFGGGCVWVGDSQFKVWDASPFSF